MASNFYLSLSATMQISRHRGHEQHPTPKEYGYFSDERNSVKTEGSQELYYSDCIRELFNVNEATLNPAVQTESKSNVLYHPNWTQWNNRVTTGHQTRATRLPFGWPGRLTGPCAWYPRDVQEEKRFIHCLTEVESSEIRTALRCVKARGLSFEGISIDSFQLPTLGPVLLAIRDNVYAGIGFHVIRGLELDQFDSNDRAIVFLGLSSYVGQERGPQDRYGTMIKHIMDDERTESLKELPFHTDVTCDVSALLTVHCSDYGGMWTVASCFAIYNELARTRPDLIHVLARPDWPFDTFGRDPPYFRRAPLYFEDGKVIFNFSRRLLAGHPQTGRSAGVPAMSEAQAEALDAVHFTARGNCLKINMKEGDLRFISNLSVLHGREGFYDAQSLESRRYVMRLWLRNREMAWKLPPALKLAWARIFDDPNRRREWIVEPYVKGGLWHGRGPRAECD